MTGMIILIGLFLAGLILMLWADYIENQEEMEKFRQSIERTKSRRNHLLEIERKYELITGKWWFKLFFRESHILGENKK